MDGRRARERKGLDAPGLICGAYAERMKFSAMLLFSTLWVLVQGRRVWIYGCVSPAYRRGGLEKGLRRIPDVELAMEEVRIGKDGKMPYRVK